MTCIRSHPPGVNTLAVTRLDNSCHFAKGIAIERFVQEPTPTSRGLQMECGSRIRHRRACQQSDDQLSTFDHFVQLRPGRPRTQSRTAISSGSSRLAGGYTKWKGSAGRSGPNGRTRCPLCSSSATSWRLSSATPYPPSAAATTCVSSEKTMPALTSRPGTRASRCHSESRSRRSRHRARPLRAMRGCADPAQDEYHAERIPMAAAAVQRWRAWRRASPICARAVPAPARQCRRPLDWESLRYLAYARLPGAGTHAL